MTRNCSFKASDKAIINLTLLTVAILQPQIHQRMFVVLFLSGKEATMSSSGSKNKNRLEMITISAYNMLAMGHVSTPYMIF